MRQVIRGIFEATERGSREKAIVAYWRPTAGRGHRYVLASALTMLLMSPTPLRSQSATDEDVIRRIRQAQGLAENLGMVAGIPNFFCKDYVDGYWIRPRCGTFLLNSVAARTVWVRDADLPPHDRNDVGEMLRAANDYAAARGHRGGYPLFEEQERSAGGLRELWLRLVLLKDGPVQWRDVPAAELGSARFDNWPRRFQQVASYASRNGFVGGFPNAHQANYGSGVVYGTQLFRADGATWIDAPGIVYGRPDSYNSGPGEHPTETVFLNRNKYDPSRQAFDCGERTDAFSFYCGTASRPFRSGRNTVIAVLTNTSTLPLRVWYSEPAQQGLRRFGPVVLQPNGATRAFAGAKPEGQIVAKTEPPTPGAPYSSPDYVTVEVEYLDPAGGIQVGSPTLPPTFRTAPDPQSYYRILNPVSHNAIEVEHNTCDARQVSVGTPRSTARSAQSWRFRSTGRGTYVIENRVAQQVLDAENPLVNGSAISPAAPVDLDPNQEFRVEHIGNRRFRIMAASGKVLDIQGKSADPGARLQLWDWMAGTDNWNQVWMLEPTGERHPLSLLQCRAALAGF